ncbi:MAG: phosphorylase [Pseudomonadota bacterium]
MSTQLEAGTLWRKLVDRTESAIACGALQRIETEHETLRQGGLPFVVRVATNLKRKAEERRERAQTDPTGGREFNPFLPPEAELTVAEISDSHLALLNKFNVVERHLLIVTRAFEHQERLLTQADFEALWLCLREYPSLGFYNGGAAAGASQKHKHLQLVPLPLYPGQGGFPLEDLYTSTPPWEGIQRLKPLPFPHAWSRLPVGLDQDPTEAAAHSLALYRRMLNETGIRMLTGTDGERQAAPYNLLMTQEWMLLVPRSREFSHGISVNALGYVGSLFVKDEQGLETLRHLGPMQLLRDVSVARILPRRSP